MTRASRLPRRPEPAASLARGARTDRLRPTSVTPLPEVEVEGAQVWRTVREHDGLPAGAPFNTVVRPPGNLIRPARKLEPMQMAMATGDEGMIEALRRRLDGPPVHLTIAEDDTPDQVNDVVIWLGGLVLALGLAATVL